MAKRVTSRDRMRAKKAAASKAKQRYITKMHGGRK